MSKIVGPGSLKKLGYVSSQSSSLVWDSSDRYGKRKNKGMSQDNARKSSPANADSPHMDGSLLERALSSSHLRPQVSISPKRSSSRPYYDMHEPFGHVKTEEISLDSDSILSEHSRRSFLSESLTFKKKKPNKYHARNTDVFNFYTGIRGSRKKKGASSPEEYQANQENPASVELQNPATNSEGPAVISASYKPDAAYQTAAHRNGYLEPSNAKKVKRRKKYIYILYLKEGIGTVASLAIVSIIISVKSLRFFTDWIIGYNIFFSGENAVSVSSYYGLSLFFVIVLFLIRGILSSILIASKSRHMRTVSTDSILGAPIGFFEKTPISVILGSLVSDIFIIDTVAPDMTLQLLSHIPEALGIVIQTSVLIAPYLAMVFIYFLYCLFVIKRYMRLHSKVARMDYTNNMRLVSHIASTIDGITTIKICNLRDRFEHFNYSLVDTCHKSFYLHMIIKYVVVLQSDILVGLALYFVMLISIVMNAAYYSVGIAVANLGFLGVYVGLIIRNIFDINLPLKGFFKFKTLCENIPSEYPQGFGSSAGDDEHQVVDPGPSWPKEGKVTFKNVLIRYDKDSPIIVKNISFNIFHAEHVGIFAEPNTGKTSLSSALLRLLPLDEGQIVIDGFDIGTVDIKRVRKSISIIPQDPLLIIGTIRSNLDPSNSVSDEEIWNVLKVVHLADRIKEESLKLDTEVANHAKSFSHFERQLFFMARAILFKSRIIVFDDPAVFDDRRSDAFFHKIIRENFVNSTVIVLSARINFLKSLDRLIIIKSKQVVETGSPDELSQDPKSVFSKLLLVDRNSPPT